MKRLMCKWRLGAAGVVCALAVAAAAQPGHGRRSFDPLDVPAAMSSLAQGTQLIGLARAGQRLVAVGWRGHILVSADNGASWQQRPVPASVDLTGVTFPTPALGWAIGHGGLVLHSSDGGQSWTRQLDGNVAGKVMTNYYKTKLAAGDKDAERILNDVVLNTSNGPEQPWLGVYFDDAEHGYVAGTFNMIMETHDGGRSWVPLQDLMDNPDSLHLNAVVGIDGDVFIPSEQGIVFRRERGAARFTAQRTGYNGSFFGVVGSRTVLIAYGLRGNAYRSVDRGATWEPVQTGVVATITGSTVMPDGRIVLVSQAGDVLVGAPDGTSFTRVNVARRYPFADVIAAGAGQLVTVGTSGAGIVRADGVQP